MVEPFVKRRERPIPGSIPDVLQMFVAEVRFYREIAPVVGVRVPECLHAEEEDGATLLLLENLSEWRQGAEPAAAARLLAGMHQQWQGVAGDRWPWLRRPDAGIDVVAAYFDETWPKVASRPDCTAVVRNLGDRLVGRIPAVEGVAAVSGPPTLVHGDASMRNIRTGPAGEVALIDWEDVGSAPGVADLAWLLVSSVEPKQWDETIAAYGRTVGLREALAAAASQGILSLANTPPESDEATDWVRRIEEAARRLT
ncbi:MAG TPA: aminoglycoside phosphotransferase family protein [Kribbella sp.]|nr:aminoglycoside phosphotransferase family protein [Kribbella sp.]